MLFKEEKGDAVKLAMETHKKVPSTWLPASFHLLPSNNCFKVFALRNYLLSWKEDRTLMTRFAEWNMSAQFRQGIINYDNPIFPIITRAANKTSAIMII